MSENILVRFFEHNRWANLEVLQACSTLGDEELDAIPQSATKGTIRETLRHIAETEQDYLAEIARSKSRINWQAPPTFEELKESLNTSGEGFIELARNLSDERLDGQIHAEDGYIIEPWVIMVQTVNHSTEHREQIKSMLTALGIKPPRVDGWGYGKLKNAVIGPAK